MMNTAQMIKTASRVTAFAAAGLFAFAFGPVHAVGATTLTDVTGSGTSMLEAHMIKWGNVAAASEFLGAWKVNEGASAVNSASSFWVYCLDPLNGFQTPDTYDKTSLSNFVTGGAFATLFAGANYQASDIVGKYDDSTTNTSKVLADLTSLYSHAYTDSLTSRTKSAAFQFAIWEIEGDGNGQTSDGKYYADVYADSGLNVDESTAFTTQVNAYLAALNTNAWGAVNGANLATATNYTFSVYNPNPAGGQALLRATVPEPGSLALAGLALFGVVYTRRQSKAKQV